MFDTRIHTRFCACYNGVRVLPNGGLMRVRGIAGRAHFSVKILTWKFHFGIARR